MCAASRATQARPGQRYPKRAGHAGRQKTHLHAALRDGAACQRLGLRANLVHNHDLGHVVLQGTWWKACWELHNSPAFTAPRGRHTYHRSAHAWQWAALLQSTTTHLNGLDLKG